MDPITLAVGGVLVLVGFIAGRLNRRKSPPPRPEYECTCRHPFNSHDPETGRCLVQIKRDKYSSRGVHQGKEYAPCACATYVGDLPLNVDPSDILRKINEGNGA